MKRIKFFGTLRFKYITKIQARRPDQEIAKKTNKQTKTNETKIKKKRNKRKEEQRRKKGKNCKKRKTTRKL